MEDCQLESTWTLYTHRSCVSNNYGENYNELFSVDTVKAFWNLYNNIPSAKNLHSDNVLVHGGVINGFSCFRDNIRPEWEHNMNISGSEWGCRHVFSADDMEAIWLSLLLGCIGEKIRHCNGIRLINKSNQYISLHKFEVWMHTCDAECTQETLSDIHACLQYKESLEIVFSKHEDASQQRKKGSVSSKKEARSKNARSAGLDKIWRASE